MPGSSPSTARKVALIVTILLLAIASYWFLHSKLLIESEVQVSEIQNNSALVEAHQQKSPSSPMTVVDESPRNNTVSDSSDTSSIETQGKDFFLKGDPYSLSGQVLTDTGDPAMNISIKCDADNGAFTQCFTDEAGLFFCNGDNADSWYCSAFDFETNLALSDQYPFSRIEPSENNNEIDTLYLYPKGEVHVFIDSSNPVPALKVYLKADNSSLKEMFESSSLLFIAKNLPLGTYQLNIPGYESLNPTIQLQNAGVIEVHVSLPETERISGRVVDNNQYPLGGKEVRTFRIVDGSYNFNDKSISPTITNQDGAFAIKNLVPGDYLIKVEGEPHNVSAHKVHTGDSIDIVIGSYSKVQVLVQTNTGTPVNQFQIAYMKYGSDDVKFIEATKEDGTVEIENLVAGKWLIGVTESPQGTGGIELELSPSQERKVEITVDQDSDFSLVNFYKHQIYKN